MYSTTDEWLLLSGFTGLSWQRAKVSAPQPSRQTAQRQASVVHPQFFSGGLFTANPPGPRGAAGQVSNAAPPLWTPSSLAALLRQIKELEAAFCLWTYSCPTDPVPWHWTLRSKAGRSLGSVWQPGKPSRACCHYSPPWSACREIRNTSLNTFIICDT